MKKNILMFFCMVMLVVSALTGCGSVLPETKVVSTSDCQNTVLVCGNHKTARIGNYNTAYESIRSTCSAEGAIAIIVADGDPYTATGDIIQIPHQQRGLSHSKLSSIHESETNQILQLMASSYAQEEEVDLLKAIELGARQVNSSRFTGKTDFYVFDPGISTKSLNFMLIDLETIDPSIIVAALKDKKMLPDLTNCGTIKWFNIGDVDYEISSTKVEGIKSIWKAIIEASGGEVVFYTDPATQSFDENLNLPYVSKLPNDGIGIEDLDGLQSDVTLAEEQPIVMTETELGFNPGECTFVDLETAEKKLSNLKDFLATDSGTDILIAGTTADWGSEEYQINLSTNRAETVKSYLVNNGIADERIETIGLGSGSKFYKYDKESDGTLSPVAAAGNRLIIVMPLDCELSNSILSGNYQRGDLIEMND